MKIKKANTKEDFLSCWELMRLLYPDLCQEHYLTLVLYMMDESYTLLFIEEDDQVVSLCGYRYQTTLQHHRSIQIDQLYTLPWVQKEEYAIALLKNVIQEAKDAECETIYVNNEYGQDEMLLFFLKAEFKIKAHHLALKLNLPA